MTYRATLDVPNHTLNTVTLWITAHRKTHDIRPWQRATTARQQAVLALRWFKQNTDLRTLARDANISIATAYRYLHEAINVISAHAPQLAQVLKHGLEEGWAFVCLYGTLIETDRRRIKGANGYDPWYSGKHKRHGGNVQVLCYPAGYPEWISPAEPGSTDDITAARCHAFPALYPAAVKGLPTLTDKGYIGAGVGIKTPVKGKGLASDTRTRNKIIAALRVPAERGNALLKQTWKALGHVSLDPYHLTEIVRAALVLFHLQRGTR